MADFSVFKSDSSLAAVVIDGSIDSTSLSIKIIGRGIIDFAQDIAENHLHIMENFANTTSPTDPVAGQLWWDTNVEILKVYDGSSFSSVGLQATGSEFDAEGNKIINVADPTLPQDAATKNYVDGAIGIVSIVDDTTPQLGGNLDAQNFRIINLANPVDSNDATNKFYVDSLASGLDPKESSRAATTANLAGYVFVNNGGVGDTLTAPAPGTTTLDTILLADDDRVLVKDQSDPKQNGIYVASDTGGGDATVLTRATDQDGSPSNEVSAGNFTFVEVGSANGSTGWVVVGDGVLTVNTDNIDWTTFTNVGGGLLNIVDDATPQLGGMLDVNGKGLGDGTNLLLEFVEDASAVNNIEIENQATGDGPIIRAVGTDTNIDLVLDTKGTGDIDASTNKIVNVVDPTLAQDAATKDYVDTEITSVLALSDIPSGTFMLFQQTSAPTGWTKQVTHNDKALRVVSGAAGSAGTTPFSTAFDSGSLTGAHTLTTGQMPSHTHTPQTSTGNAGGDWNLQSNGFSTGLASADKATTATGGGGSHTHTLSTFDVQYVDLIIASKD